MIYRGWTLIKLLGRPYVPEVLSSLYEGPKRFVDLSKACPNERTRTNRLRALEKAKIIETKPLKIDKRTFVHYCLTEKGRRTFEAVVKLVDEFERQ